MNFYTLHFDGACAPKNPGGTASYGFALSCLDQQIEHGKGIIGTGPSMSNNVGELYAAAEGLLCFLKHFTGEAAYLNVRGDSRLAINVLSRRWKAHEDKLYYAEFLRAAEALRQVRSRNVMVSFEWIPRELNTVCDDLSKAYLTDKTS